MNTGKESNVPKRKGYRASLCGKTVEEEGRGRPPNEFNRNNVWINVGIRKANSSKEVINTKEGSKKDSHEFYGISNDL